jgi:hypothetical protein
MNIHLLSRSSKCLKTGWSKCLKTGWLFIFLICPALVFAKPTKERYPIISSFSTGISFNHSNFVGSETNSAASQYGLEEADGFGWATMSFNMSLSYLWKFSKKVSPIFVSGGIGFSRALSESFSRAGLSTVQPKQFNVQDLSVNMGWNLPKISKKSKLNMNAGLSVSAPLSRSSRSIGLASSISSRLALIYPTSIGLVLQAVGFVGYNILTTPTIQVDCALMPQYCRISGEDLGAPNRLMSWGGVVGTQIPLFGGLRFSLSYRMFGGMGAVQFPETTEENLSSEYAQGGNQYSIPFHGTSFGLIFGFNQTGSGAQQALNESLKKGKKGKKSKKKESSFLDKLNLSLSMSTGQRLYSLDNKRITVPLFDFETNNKSRTSYNFGMNLAF